MEITVFVKTDRGVMEDEAMAKRVVPVEMMEGLKKDMEDCRVAFIAGFGGDRLVTKYRALCDFCFEFGIPLDSLI